MKNISVLFALFFVSANQVYSLDFDPYAGPKPIIVLIETNPWLMVIGSDTPDLAIYENGLVIQKIRNGNATELVSSVLTKDQLGVITGQVTQLLGQQIPNKNYDIAPGVTDQPETKIYASLENVRFASSIYGLFLSDENILGHTISPTTKGLDMLPGSLLKAYQYLTGLKLEHTTDWNPDYFEVLIWDYSYAPEESIIWPKDWPDLESSSSLKRGSSYSLFLKGAQIGSFVEFISKRNEKGAVQISGKKWAVSWKYAFPGELDWRKALR